MITNFDSLFAGHVDVDNVGYAGTPVNDRSFSDEYLATAFDKSLAIAQLMDRTGYDTFWLAEHHFQLEGYECIPNILMLSVHLSHLREDQFWLWLQYHPHVASPAAGRRLCHRRYLH